MLNSKKSRMTRSKLGLVTAKAYVPPRRRLETRLPRRAGMDREGYGWKRGYPFCGGPINWEDAVQTDYNSSAFEVG